MKYILLLLAVPVLISETCKEKKEREAAALNVPSCIQHKIDSISKEPKWNPPAEVNEYSYKGKKVYLFSSDCCDFFNPLIDTDCNYICSPSGGITGKGDMQCRDFDSLAKHIRLVWRDKR